MEGSEEQSCEAIIGKEGVRLCQQWLSGSIIDSKLEGLLPAASE